MRASRCLAVWTVGMTLLLGPMLPRCSAAASAIEATPPPFPQRTSPADQFRRLLEMEPAQREAALTGLPEQKQKILRAKIQEYSALTSEERERRLQVINLQYYVEPLLKTPPAERAPILASIPAADRKVVEQRLELWDRLPADVQKEFLEHETTIQCFVRLEAGTPMNVEALIKSLSPDRLQSFEKWRSLPLERRRKMYEQFHQFFELSPAERQKTLSTLSDAERQQLEKVVAGLLKLSEDERRICLDSLRKWAEMPPVDRGVFLRNLERWQAMSPAEKRAWQSLVTKLPPPPPMPGELSALGPVPRLPGDHSPASTNAPARVRAQTNIPSSGPVN